jgi:predicted lactoylglutathione lyase
MQRLSRLPSGRTTLRGPVSFGIRSANNSADDFPHINCHHEAAASATVSVTVGLSGVVLGCGALCGGVCMTTTMFVNLPVKDLARAVEFFAKLGFSFDAKFSDDNATCMIVEENIFVMLLEENFFKTFTHKRICNTEISTEALLCISRDSRDSVDEMVSLAVANGAFAPRQPKDYGFMYQHGFEDLDGHAWELIYIAPRPGGDIAR